MFTKENKPESFKNAETVIGSSIKVKGNFSGQGNVVIDGVLEGSVKTGSDLFIGEKAKVTANLEAQNAVINGEVRGNLKIQGYLSLGSTARLIGDVQYAEISIEKGAIIQGQIVFNSENGKKAQKEETDIEESENEE